MQRSRRESMIRGTEKINKLVIRNIQKNFDLDLNKIEVLKDIDLAVNEGEFVSIVGASGCGKSTLLKLIIGLEKSTDGEIIIGERKVSRPSIDCGMVFQEARLFPWLTVEKNIEFGIAKKMSKKERRKIVEEHIKLVGLSGFEKALPKQLSGGMQQRVSIARALVNRPEVLLLDEPFGALDALTRIHMQNEVLNIWSTEKNTMILVTHDIDEAIFLSDRVIVMSDRPGCIKEVMPVDMPRPRDRSSEEFVRIRTKIYKLFFKSSNIDLENYL